MKGNILKYIVLLLVVFLVVVIFNRAFSQGRRPTIVASNTTSSRSNCLAVRQDVGPGVFIENRMLEWRDCGALVGKPESGDYFWGNDNEYGSLAGSVVRKALATGDLVPVRDVIKPGDTDFLSAVLKPGSRAIAIRVDDVTGGAGLIRPGNTVDVLVSGKFDYQTPGVGDIPTAKTLLRAVRVLAVNRDVMLQEQSAATETSRYTPGRENRGTITLEVSPKEVELLNVAKTMGTLSLALCSLDEESAPDTQTLVGHTLGTEIVAPSERAASDTMAPSTKAVVTMYGTNQSRQVTN